VPVEVAAFVAIAFAPWPESVPIALPLIVVATLARLIRGKSWGELFHRRGAWLAVAAGAAALGVALLAGTPLIEAMTAQTVGWAQFPMVRGNTAGLLPVAMLVAAITAGMELGLRGWVVDRALEFAPPVVAVAIGAGAEALLADGTWNRVGAACFGAGLGWMYVASGRNLAVPVCARLAFQLGCVGLEYVRVIG